MNLYDLPDDILDRIFLDVHKHKFKECLEKINDFKYDGIYYHYICLESNDILFIVMLP
jgi:hypothetical protein